MFKKFIATAAVALVGAFGFMASNDVDTAEANHANGMHWQRYGDNPQFGRFIWFKDFTSQGFQYWDKNIAPTDGVWDFQTKWIEQLGDESLYESGYYHLLPIDGTAYGSGVPSDIPIYSTYRTDEWCGGQAQGCANYYVWTGTNYFAYVDVTLNDADHQNPPPATITSFQRKVVLCHEVGHALGLSHTGTESHMAMPGCMDVKPVNQGGYHFAVDVPYFHDGNMFDSIYNTGFNPNYPYGPMGTPAVGSKGDKHEFKNTRATKQHQKKIEDRMPAKVKKLLKEGKIELAETHALPPIGPSVTTKYTSLASFIG